MPSFNLHCSCPFPQVNGKPIELVVGCVDTGEIWGKSEDLLKAIEDTIFNILPGDEDVKEAKWKQGMISVVCDGARINLRHWTGMY